MKLLAETMLVTGIVIATLPSPHVWFSPKGLLVLFGLMGIYAAIVFVGEKLFH